MAIQIIITSITIKLVYASVTAKRIITSATNQNIIAIITIQPVAIGAAISPYSDTRNEVRAAALKDGVAFVEVHVHAPMETLLKRDTKGLYAKALAGEVKHFTGVDDPYEAPATPDLSLDTSTLDTATCTTRILEVLARYGVVP